MSWNIDPYATRAAAEVFRPRRPVVRRNGRQYVIESTPFGKVELIPLPGGRFLAAAESPPRVMPSLELARLGRDALGHLRRNKLRAWKIVPGSNVAEALRHLLEDGSQGNERSQLLTWLAYGCELTKRAKLLGRARLPLAEQLAAMVGAHEGEAPVPALVGPAGVGKRTVLFAVAERMGLSAVELPLRRILTDRILQTPMECFLDTVLVAAGHMAEGDLLAVSDAELIAELPQDMPRYVLTELNILPNVVLLADTHGWAAEKTPCVVPLACPGLADTHEACELMRAHGEEPDLAGPALSMICRAASLPAVGIVPGRLLYVARLAKAMTAKEGSISARQPLSPDEVAPAIHTAQQAYQARDSNV